MIKTNSKYKSKNFFSWISSKVEIKDTQKYGIGAFAKKEIKKDERIIMFGGYIMTRKEEDKLPKDIYDNAIQIDDDLVMGVKTKKEVDDGSMFNHSCNANAGIKGQILLVAIRNIKKGEQITFDFGTVLFRGKGVKPYKLKCLCGDKNCRGFVTDNDWRIQDVQKRYKGYFPLHIQDKINKIK